MLSSDVLRDLLNGTGFYVNSVRVGKELFHFGISEKEKTGLFKRKERQVYILETGVGFIEVYMNPLEPLLREAETRLDEKMKEREEKIRGITMGIDRDIADTRERIDELSSLVAPDPTGLFVKPPQS